MLADAATRGAAGAAAIHGDFDCGDEARQLIDHRAWLPLDGEHPNAQVQVPSIAVNSHYVYAVINWTLGEQLLPLLWRHTVIRIPVGTGDASRIAEEGSFISPVSAVAALADGVVFGLAPTEDGGTGRVVHLSEDGTEAVLATTSGSPAALLVDGTNVYFVDEEGTKRSSLDGGEATLLTTVAPISLSLIDGRLYLPTRKQLSTFNLGSGALANLDMVGYYPTACDDDGSFCYLTEFNPTSSLVRVRGGEQKVLAQGLLEPHALLFDGNSFFMTAGGGDAALVRVPADGGMVLSLSQAGFGLAETTDCLYWTAAAGIFSWSADAADAAGQ
jgi:hypothetical protein